MDEKVKASRKVPRDNVPIDQSQGETSRLGTTAACYRTEKAQIPKSAGESAGKNALKTRTAGGTAGSSAESSRFPWKLPLLVPPAVLFFPGALYNTPRGTFGDLGFLCPVAGGRDS